MTTAASETTTLLTVLVRSLVKDRNAVCVTNFADQRGHTTFQVTVARHEQAKVIGSQGRTVKSLRHLLFCIGREHDQFFDLEVETDPLPLRDVVTSAQAGVNSVQGSRL